MKRSSVIHFSRTSQPPRLTPLRKGSGPAETGCDGVGVEVVVTAAAAWFVAPGISTIGAPVNGGNVTSGSAAEDDVDVDCLRVRVRLSVVDGG